MPWYVELIEVRTIVVNVSIIVLNLYRHDDTFEPRTFRLLNQTGT